MGRLLLLLVLATSLASAGCFDNGAAGEPPAVPDVAPHPVTATAIGAKALATPAGHRINEFWLARDPTDPRFIAAGSMDGDDPEGGSICTVTSSTDAGTTWSEITPPGFRTVLGQADPWVTFAPDGTLHATCMEWGGNSTNGATLMLYTRSHDRGATWSDVQHLPGYDREIMFAARDGTLYYCVADDEGTAFMASVDGGATWTTRSIPEGVGNCHSLSQGPDDALYLGTGLRVLRSEDGGRNWTAPVARFEQHVFHDDRCDFAEPLGGQATLYCSVVFAFAPVPFPIWSHAVDPVHGDVYVAFQNLTEEQGPMGQLYHVEVYRSSDQGLTYAPIAVPPQAHHCEGCHSSRPVVHVDDRGILGMTWRQGETNLVWQSWFAASADGGQTWSGPVKLGETGPEDSPAMPGNLAPKDPGAVYNPVVEWAGSPDASDAGQQRLIGGGTEPTWGTRYEGGHYASMTSTPDGFLPCWIDLDGGVPQLWCQTVRVDEASA